MGIARGTNIVRDGLVFGYDNGYGVSDNTTATRFNKGEPTTNLQSSVQHADGQLYAVQSVGVSYVGEEDGWSKYSLNGSWTAGTYPYSLRINSTSFTGGVKYSTQCKIKTNVPHKFTYFASNGFSYVNEAMDHQGVNSSTLLDEGCYLLKREGFAYTSSTSQPGYLWTRGNSETFSSSTDFVYIKDFMVEQKDHCTPWTATSRSSTQSLIDLKRTTGIDVSNISFDSTGQPSFDETNDHITGTLPMNGLGAPHTIEMVFSCNVNQGSIGGRKDPFSIGNAATHQYSALDVNTGYMNWYFYSRDTSFTNSPLMVANKFYHIVLSYAGGSSNNTNKKVWFNGVQQTLGSGSSETPLLPNNPSFSVGRDRGRNTAYWPGEIPVWKVYQKAFTQEEAQQNYNAYKHRFNI